MGRSDNSEPAEVVDRLLWRDAQQIMARHCGPDSEDRCQWCGADWPCPPRHLAERADAASRRPPPESPDAAPDPGSQPRIRRGWRLDPGYPPGRQAALPGRQQLQAGRQGNSAGLKGRHGNSSGLQAAVPAERQRAPRTNRGLFS